MLLFNGPGMCARNVIQKKYWMVPLLMSISNIGTDIGYIKTVSPAIIIIIDLGAIFFIINFAKVHLCLFSSISKKYLHHPRLHHRLLILDIVIDELGIFTFNKNFFVDFDYTVSSSYWLVLNVIKNSVKYSIFKREHYLEMAYVWKSGSRLYNHYLKISLLTRIVGLMWL